MTGGRLSPHILPNWYLLTAHGRDFGKAGRGSHVSFVTPASAHRCTGSRYRCVTNHPETDRLPVTVLFQVWIPRVGILAGQPRGWLFCPMLSWASAGRTRRHGTMDRQGLESPEGPTAGPSHDGLRVRGAAVWGLPSPRLSLPGAPADPCFLFALGPLLLAEAVTYLPDSREGTPAPTSQ